MHKSHDTNESYGKFDTNGPTNNEEINRFRSIDSAHLAVMCGIERCKSASRYYTTHPTVHKYVFNSIETGEQTQQAKGEEEKYQPPVVKASCQTSSPMAGDCWTRPRSSGCACHGLGVQYENLTPPLCSDGMCTFRPQLGPPQNRAGSKWLMSFNTHCHSGAPLKALV